MRPLSDELTDEQLYQHFDVVSELAECHCALAEYGKAERYYREASNLAPERPEPHTGLGTLFLQMNLLADAKREFEIAIELDQRNPEALNGLAAVALKENKASEAFDAYLESLRLDPDNLLALLGLFRTSCMMGTFSRVIEYFQVYLDMHPGDTSVMFCLATLYAREGDPGECRAVLERLLVLEPDHKEALQLLSDTEDTGAHTKAVTNS